MCFDMSLEQGKRNELFTVQNKTEDVTTDEAVVVVRLAVPMHELTVKHLLDFVTSKSLPTRWSVIDSLIMVTGVVIGSEA